MNEIQFTQSEMEALKKVAPDHNTTNGYGTDTNTIINIPSVEGSCANRLPCGVCLLTNKKCPLCVETERINIGDPPYPYGPFTWSEVAPKIDMNDYITDCVKTKAYNED